MTKEIVQWADPAMFEAAPMQKDSLGRIVPQVHLLSATPDPLGALAAGVRMYKGVPTYNLEDLTREDREWAWQETLKTHLKAPWELIDFHFFIEAVTRSFTHQMVRQRTAVYVQESLRFAVKRGLADEVAKPPSIAGLKGEGPAAIWNRMVEDMADAYNALVDAGIPAEDARGLLPHAVTTRIHYKTNLRNLVDQAGVRLCTQAQFEWRHAFMGIIKAIREFQGPHQVTHQNDGGTWGEYPHAWQFELLGQPIAQTFTPVCYHAGHCTFMGELDRHCSIRERVQAFSAAGVPSTEWHLDLQFKRPDAPTIKGIRPEEWIANPEAARPQE